METLGIFFVTLTVFGLGVTAIDFLGLLGHHGGDHQDGSAEDACTDSEGHHGHTEHEGHHGSYLGADKTGLRLITGLLGVLRTAVYFALGAGPTGLFALLTKHTRPASLLWSLAGGAFIAVLARLLRRLLRRDLDSSIKPGEFILEKGILLTPIAPGAMGKALVRQFGKETELYVRCRDPRLGFLKGSEIRIVDCDDSLYWIEPL